MDCDLGCSANALRDCHFFQPSLILPPITGIILCFAHGSFLSQITQWQDREMTIN